MPTAIKLSDSFVDLARRESDTMGRSIAGQVEHWARIGRAVESAPGFDHERLRRVLEARDDYDALPAAEQAAALAMLGDYLEDLPRDGDAAFFSALRAAGVTPQGETAAAAPRRRAAAKRA